MGALQQRMSVMKPWCAQPEPTNRSRTQPVDNSESPLKCVPMIGEHSPDLGTTRGRDHRHPQIAGTGYPPPDGAPSMEDARGNHPQRRNQEAGADPMDERIAALAMALAACLDLRQPGLECERLWIALKEAVCTRGRCRIVPLGSSAPVEVTDEYAGQELAEAMTWLRRNETEARSMPPVDVYRRLRAAATKGAHGSARMAQQDALHGMTEVSPGDPITFASSEIEL